MAVWNGSTPEPPPPVVAAPAELVESTAPKPAPRDAHLPANPNPSRSSMALARERLAAEQLPSIEKRAWLRDNAADESVALRAAEGLNRDGGLVMPQVQVVAHVVVDAAEAFEALSRLLGERGSVALDVESEVVEGG